MKSRRRQHGHEHARPLGIDIGSSRIRVARLEDSDGRPNLLAVAARGRNGEVFDTLRDAIDEVDAPNSRWVVGISEPAGLVRIGTFPAKMGASERERAARFEVARYIDYPVSEAVLRLYRTPHTDQWVVAVARKRTLDDVSALAKRMRCHLTAVDHAAFALRRAFPDIDCIVDVGELATICYVFTPRMPIVQRIDIGGRAFTEALRDSLGIDHDAAERRKQTVGLAGAGEHARDRLVDAVAGAFIEVRASGAGDVTAAALVGNGARLEGLAGAIERVTAVPVRMAALAPTLSRVVPPDVMRAATPDWAVAVGLAMWTNL